jgi:hypothetical protein
VSFGDGLLTLGATISGPPAEDAGTTGGPTTAPQRTVRLVGTDGDLS